MKALEGRLRSWLRSCSDPFIGEFSYLFGASNAVLDRFTVFNSFFCTRKPGRDETWSPTLLGFSKRDLLKDVLTVFGELN